MQPPGSAAPADEPVRAGGVLSWNIRVLGVASLINDVASEMIFPLIPGIHQSLAGAPARWERSKESPTPRPVSSSSGLAAFLTGRENARCSFSPDTHWPRLASFIALVTSPWQVLLVRASIRQRNPRGSSRCDDRRFHGCRVRADGLRLHAGDGPFRRGHRTLIGIRISVDLARSIRTLFLLTAIPGLFVVLWVFAGLREQPVTLHSAEKFHWSLSAVRSRLSFLSRGAGGFYARKFQRFVSIGAVRELGVELLCRSCGAPFMW